MVLGLVIADALVLDDIQGLEVLAVQQVGADGEPHGPHVLGPPRHDPPDVPGLDAAVVLPERRHRRGGLEHRRLLHDDDRRADLELRLRGGGGSVRRAAVGSARRALDGKRTTSSELGGWGSRRRDAAGW